MNEFQNNNPEGAAQDNNTSPPTPTFTPAQYPTYNNPNNHYSPQINYTDYPPQGFPHNPMYESPEPAPNNIPEPDKAKTKINIGRVVLAVCICLCIVVCSIAVGMNISQTADPQSGVTEEQEGNNREHGTGGDGPEADLQDSPLVYKEYSGSGSMTAQQVYDAVKDINVGILVYANGEMIGEGSGIIVGEDDSKTYTYIITAAHVISDPGVSIQVQFSDESECDATIVGNDPKTDIGVIRVKKTGLKAAVFGDSSKLVVGQTVYAIGNPGGTEFFGSFTSGMVSAIDRPVPTTSSSYDLPCIQHNAAINPGNSGGALVNEFGQVIGLNSSKISSTEYEGMGFSVPASTMIEIYNAILADGYVAGRPMLGINYIAVSTDSTYSSIAFQNDLPYGSIVIASISKSSDLNNHDIEIGDVITGVNGKRLNTTDVLLEIIENASVGDELTLSVCRLTNRGSIEKEFNVKIKLVEDIGDNVVAEPEESSSSLEDYIYGE